MRHPGRAAALRCRIGRRTRGESRIGPGRAGPGGTRRAAPLTQSHGLAVRLARAV